MPRYDFVSGISMQKASRDSDEGIQDSHNFPTGYNVLSTYTAYAVYHLLKHHLLSSGFIALADCVPSW